MGFLNIVAPPLIGGVIRYITNYIAIKMLFRPLKPITIGRFRVPFTPGIIPKRKDELAGILGKAVVDQFFNADDLEIIFLSDSFTNAVADRIAALLGDHDTKLRFLDPEQSGNEMMQKLKDELCIRIQAAILKSDLKSMIGEQGGRIIKERFGGSMVGKVLNEATISSISAPIAEQIEKYILENGRSAIMPLIDAELAELSQEPVANIINEIIPDREAQLAFICDIYTRFMKVSVRPIVESIDVGGMITEKVRLMDAASVEKLVLTVVNRELRYVVWLGALIGAVIGAVNIFI